MSMRLRPSFWVGIVLPAIMAAFLVLLVYSAVQLMEIGDRMRLESPHNMLWVTAQARKSGLQLALSLRKYKQDKSERDKLVRQHQIFVSRIALFEQGPQYRQLQAMGFANALGRITSTLSEFNHHFHLVLQGHLAPLPEMLRELQEINSSLDQMTTTSMATEWERLGGKLERERQELWKVLTSLVIILVAGTALVVYLTLALLTLRRQKRLLNEEKALSELVIQSSEESIIVLDNSRLCRIWSPASEAMFQLAAEQMLGKSIVDLSGLFDRPDIAASIDEALSGYPSVLNQVAFSERFFEFRTFPLRSRDSIIGAIIMAFDITDLREAEREIALHRDHLEELVEERTQALDKALERERLSGELSRNFGAMLSHQFRTPLAVVDSSLQRLIRRRYQLTAEEVRERGETARQAIKRLVQLVNSTLDAARLEGGLMQARKQPVDMGKLMERFFIQQQELFPNRLLRLQCQPSPSLQVYADPTHIEHILNNLVSNANKYSIAGSPIDIVLAQDHQQLCCEVINEGRLDADRSALFNRYYRGNNIAGTAGIGLGLYMAKMLARLQNGDVRVDVDLPECVRFTLCLPVITRATAEQEAV